MSLLDTVLSVGIVFFFGLFVYAKATKKSIKEAWLDFMSIFREEKNE
jgi:hypothetical protein